MEGNIPPSSSSGARENKTEKSTLSQGGGNTPWDHLSPEPELPKDSRFLFPFISLISIINSGPLNLPNSPNPLSMLHQEEAWPTEFYRVKARCDLY